MGLSIQDGANHAKDSATSYIELSSKVYSLFLDTLTSLTQRRLQYWKSVWEVSSRPYQLTPVEGTVRDGFDRVSQILDLTANELKTDGQNAAEFSEKLLSHTTRFQDVAMNAFRSVLNTSISNLDYVEETTQQQFNGLTKRLDEAEHRAGATASTK
jgi:hypothetical protein